MSNDDTKTNPDQRSMSDSIDLLSASLAKAQGEFNVALKNSKNPFFKSNYADYESVVEASRVALSKHGLSVDFGCDIHWELNVTFMTAMLNHSSGQWKKSKLPYNPVKADIQSLSSYNTYLKRMLYCNLTGVVTGEGDDDGETAMERPRITTINQPQVATISQSQFELLSGMLDKLDSSKAEQICNHYNINSLQLLPQKEFFSIVEKLRKQLPKGPNEK